MMGLLGITSLRPGPSGNPKAPNAANLDESKATPYPDLPDPLVLKNGKKVTTAEAVAEAPRRRSSRTSTARSTAACRKGTPAGEWEVTEQCRGGRRRRAGDVTKTLVGHVDNSSYPPVTVDIQLTLTTPANAAGPVPVIMEFGFGPRPGRRAAAAASAGPTLAAAGAREGLGLRDLRARTASRPTTARA